METIGRYEILGELGRGGCGVVYRALDPAIGRSVAIKTIRLDSDFGDLRERFRREARSAGILSHPNIVTIHEFNDTGDVMFIAMEYIEGETLAQRMREGLLSIEFTLATLRAAADALDFAHAHNIVHRDVKPANFLITKHGHLKMADFGIAKILDGDLGLTHTGMVIGTAQYMSPEQIAAKEVTGRSDQFSLAVIAYEMLAGRRPFLGDSWASMMHAIIASEPPPLSQFHKELGDGATAVVLKGLSKDPQNRYSTCKAFAHALEVAILGSTGARSASWQQTGAATQDGAMTETVDMSALPRPAGFEMLASQAPVSMPRSAGTAAILRTSTREITSPGPPPAPARSWAVPITTGALIVIGLGAWVGLRNYHSPDVAPARSASVAPATGLTSPQASNPAPPSTSPAAPPATATVEPVPNVPAKTSKEPKKEARREPVKTEPAKTESARAAGTPSLPLPPVLTPAPSPAIVTPTRTPQAGVSTAPVSSAPIAPPAVVPARVEEDRVAEDARHAADEQTKRLKEEQARTAAEEKVKAARAAELQSVSRALADYQGAYDRKDPAALQAIWPSIPKASLDGIRSSFRDASEVSMQLHPVGDPEISGATATVICDRNLRQVIMKRPMQASNQVRIVLNRRGAGWVITSIETINR
jgi:serine/threonine-protein kinase